MLTLSFITILGWFYLALFHGQFWKLLFPPSPISPPQWPSVDIIVPARDEAEALPNSLPSLLAQNYPGPWRIVLVDDHSSDGTGNIARQITAEKNATEKLTVINAPEKPSDWNNGKLAAMNAGVAHSTADYILFTDADIRHQPHNLRALVSRAVSADIDLVSQMVKLHCQTFAEKLLIPAFVFFFAMLYPFRRANNPYSKIAAAAGGVILLKRTTLNKAGGLDHIKAELIDDCALARAVKYVGGKTELTLTTETESLRVYPNIKDVWQMIARTAFTQLHYSALLLAGTVAGMGILFFAPVFLPLTNSLFAGIAGLLAWLIMSLLYVPTVRFYGLPVWWAITLPVAAIIYIAATVDSALLYWQGKGGQWKGRSQA